MDNWDSGFLDLVEEAHLTFEGKPDVEIAFGALKGFLDVRYSARDCSACAEFSWEGHDENGSALGANDNWQDDPSVLDLEQNQIAPPNAAEAATILHLPAGAYTAIALGADGGTGVGLVEVYNLETP